MAESDQNRRTPPWLFKYLQEFLGVRFQLDAAANRENALCRLFYDETKNGLALPWKNPTFNNPPFRYFGDWAQKAYLEAAEKSILVCQIGPVGCSQSWFQEFARKGTVLVPDERISFFDSATGMPTRGADRDSHIFVYGPGWWNRSKEGWRVIPLPVKGMVVRAKKSAA